MSCSVVIQSGKRKGLECGRLSCCYHKSNAKQNPQQNSPMNEKNRIVRITTRPTIQNVKLHYEQLSDYTFTLPKTKNKGEVGLFLEKQLGIPASSATLDCVDGEVKCFPLHESGKVKESVAVTMMHKEFQIKKEAFEESKVYQKLKKTLFIPYVRKGDEIRFFPCMLFDESHPLFIHLKNDYLLLQNSPLTGRYGMYLQTRTKGPGHGSTSRAFYLRPHFLQKLINLV